MGRRVAGHNQLDSAVSTPGRICLFGEHQDYLNLPVISAAISLRVVIRGRPRADGIIHVSTPDVGSELSFSLHEPLRYEHDRDYFRSGLKVLRDAGLTFSTGLECTVRGDIPINAGTSSSSALVVSWINFLAQMSDQQRTLSPEECATYAHMAEVVEFQEPGGRMDHYGTAFGGVLALTFHPALQIERLNPPRGRFILGDSGEPKNTRIILARAKDEILGLLRKISLGSPDFSLHTVKIEQIDRYISGLDAREKELLKGTLRNRDITQEGIKLLCRPELDERRFGLLLDEHHSILRDVLKVSTPKLDRMLEAASKAGAYGGKLNGSGGGGCMFAYAPEGFEDVAEAVVRSGGRAYDVTIDSGTRSELLEKE